MNEQIKNYERILKELSEKHFPLLKNKKIYIKEKEAKYRAKVSHLPWGFKITMSTKLRKFPEKSWKRILTHELCHLEIFSKRSWIITNIEFIFFLLSKKVRNKVEREANILMIQKGFGKEVLTARKGNISRGLDYSLSEKEIKDLIKEYSQKKRKNKNQLEKDVFTIT